MEKWFIHEIISAINGKNLLFYTAASPIGIPFESPEKRLNYNNLGLLQLKGLNAKARNAGAGHKTTGLSEGILLGEAPVKKINNKAHVKKMPKIFSVLFKTDNFILNSKSEF